MNFLGHTFVALATGDQEDPLYLLGAALPDLASMAGVRLDRSRLDGSLGRGVRCHVAADAVFHARPEFRHGAAGIRLELMRRGLRRGSARAVGHVGWELMLDGTLVGSPVEVAFRRALEAGDQARFAIAAADRSRWDRFLARWRRAPTARLGYDDPAWVADRLYAMLSRRPRLSFPADDLPAVRQVMSDHALPVATVAEQVLAATVAPGMATGRPSTCSG